MKIRALALLFACSAAACGGDPSGLDPRFVTNPSCSSPAPLYGQPDTGAPDMYLVMFEDGVNAAATASQLAALYGFQTTFVYEHAVLGFAATMDKDVVAGLRCESSVKYVEHDMVIHLDD